MFGELNTQLHRVIEEQSLDDVVTILEIGSSIFVGGADINARNDTYNTPLCHAIANGQILYFGQKNPVTTHRKSLQLM
jgi:ankyrin repeat protein